ncbi:hypothetical protein H112_05581 [Trichophyton rubrum D6]|uniref:Uncharacterized protein n=3 Tax=Trichophyton rubrum TaxID=5551 RepID=A0A178EQ27_TRIRU|nr:uncharacterized protein TERG_03311 [Trichophyton rubrum CBS 118892]EZF16575.1 hypothetical protein H100_05599 [Trichophyton rubrum MR850]EZF40254.1 hypothetical protein H102_05566 [Trichophyton rubrum CBS 100081]EZF51079.1 hypothetical protein H103_05589 [Trichophyton rubrum CBS 288.86]EZF61479.1 hypothetical protein H104_05580 [Trichophyton rubrum CBS 289.86]EZF82900.1 hypothetical protein H110_05589 [Trichophyton rubrum MR1448]EZF93439.1 hypothetical protein H113_05636 [Trichophyton rubr
MDFKPQDFVHYLLAAAGAFPHDQPGISLISEEDGDLIEKLWTGTEIANQVFVASDVRKNTPGLYLLGEEERSIFFVDKSDVLQWYRYDPDEEEWSEVEVDNQGKLTVHQSSRLSGCLSPGGEIVIFEGPENGLRAYRVTEGDKFETLPPLSANLEPGTPHQAVLLGDDTLHLLYVHRDRRIHHLVAESPGLREWKDTGSSFPYPSFNHDEKIVSFIVIPQGDGSLEICALMSGGALVQVKTNGQITQLGTVKQGRFTAHTSEECGIELMIGVKKGIKAVAHKMKK